MPNLVPFGATSNLVRFIIKDKNTGQGKTGLSTATAGLVVSTIADVEAAATAYTQAGGTLQTIATLGTFAAPSASNCRFREVDNVNHKGLYEFQFLDARFAVASAKRLVISVNDSEATILDADYEIELTQFNPFDAVRLGLTSLPSAAVGSGANSFNLTAAGNIKADVEQWQGTNVLTPDTAGAPKLSTSDSLLIANGTGTATAGGASTITLQTALGADHFSEGCVIKLVSGTGAGQVRGILSYVNSTQVVTVDRAWSTQPANGSVYAIYSFNGPMLNPSNYASSNVIQWLGSALGTTIAGIPRVDVVDWLGTAVTAATAGIPDVNAKNINNVAAATPPTTAQIATAIWQDSTASDFTTASSIGKSLYTSGNAPGAANGLFIAGTNAATSITTGLTAHIIGTVDTLTTYTGNTPQTGDCFARLGAPAGASIAADLAEIEGETDGIAAIPTNPFTGTLAQIATQVWQDSTASDFTAAGSIGKSLAPATLGTIPGAAGGLFIAGTNAATTVNFTGTITTVTNLTNLPAIPAGWLTAAGITAGALNGKGDWYVSGAVLTESYSTSTFTIEQALYEIAQKVGQFSIAGTTLTFQKRDKVTTAGTDTLNDSVNPTSRTRAT